MTPEERAARDERRRYALACELENWKPGKVREGVRQGWAAMERQGDDEQMDLRASVRRLARDLDIALKAGAERRAERDQARSERDALQAGIEALAVQIEGWKFHRGSLVIDYAEACDLVDALRAIATPDADAQDEGVRRG